MKKIISVLKLLVFANGLLYTSAFSARPFSVDDAGTVSQGKFELETAVDYWSDYALPSMCFKHGLTERMDIGFASDYQALPKSERAYHQAELGLKFALVPDAFTLSIATVLGTPEYALSLIYSTDIKDIHMDFNTGFVPVVEANEEDYTYGISMAYPIQKLEVGAELTGENKTLPSWMFGGRYEMTEWMVIDAGIAGGFEDEVDTSIVTGLWFAIP